MPRRRALGFAIAGLAIATSCRGSSGDDKNFTTNDPTAPAESSSGAPDDGATTGGTGGTTAGSGTTDGTTTGTTGATSTG